MAKTGGTGVIHFEMDSFYTTNNQGDFQTTGKATCLGCADGVVTVGDDDCEDAPVIGEVSFDSDTVGGASAHASLVHSPTLTDWTVVEDAGVKYYESNEDQTNLKIEFTEVTLADGEALRVKVDYQFLSEPTSPGMQPFNFLRFGAYHDQDTTDYGDDEGYLADVSYWKTDTTSGATKSGDYAIRKETNFYDDFDLGPLLDNVSATDYSPPAVIDTGDIVTMGSWTKSADEGITDEHAAVLCLVNDGGVITASLTHAFPIAYIGSVSDTAADSMVTFNTVYLESPSDNNGFRIRRVGVQHVGVDDPCCDPGEPIDPDDPGQGDDCLIVHSEHVDGDAGGDPTSFSYTAAEAEQADFINMVTAMGLTHDTITFEVANGWNPVNGDGDMFAGSGAPYAGGANTSAAYAASGDMASGTAEGKVDYSSAANTVIFELYNNGHAATPPDEPGIGDMDGTNDTDRGINTTLSGNHFLEVLPSDNAAGGLHIKFAVQPVAAVGFYLMGVEETKRDIELKIYLSDGSVVDASADILAGPLDQGGLQFLGYHVSSLSDTDCLIEGLSFHQPTSPDGAAAAGRDIFALDDIIYSIGGDVPHQGSDCVDFEELTLSTVYSVGDSFSVADASGTLTFDVVAEAFEWADGTMTSIGSATVVDDGLAGHFGNEMEVNNINLTFTATTDQPPGLSILFGEYGGNINVMVNGSWINADDFADLDNTALGGAKLFVPWGGDGDGTGQLLIDGQGSPITSFAIGGQELWIDHICAPSDDPWNPGGGDHGGGDYVNICEEFETFTAPQTFLIDEGFDTPSLDLHVEGWDNNG